MAYFFLNFSFTCSFQSTHLSYCYIHLQLHLYHKYIQLKTRQNKGNLKITNDLQRWHIKNKALLMLLYSSTLLCWRRTKVDLIFPLQLLDLGPTKDLIWGNRAKEQPQWLLLTLAASEHCSSPECSGEQQALLCSLTSPAQSSFLSTLQYSVWKAKGCRRIPFLNQYNDLLIIVVFFLVEGSTGFELLPWKSYYLLQSRLDVMFSWSSKNFLGLYFRCWGWLWEFFFFFVSVEFAKTVSTDFLIWMVTCSVSSFF